MCPGSKQITFPARGRAGSPAPSAAAGGIGVALNTAMNLFQWDRVAVVLLAIFAVVIVAEVVVTWVRGRIL